MASRARSLLVLALLWAAMLVAPGCAAPEDDGAGSASAVTAVPSTPVKEQYIPNCWLYASVAWAEGMHLRATGNTVNLSESYLAYWDFFAKITDPSLADGTEIKTSGNWGDAAELMRRYGLVLEKDFIAAEADEIGSQIQYEAIFNANLALTEGPLKTRAARRDKALVRRTLNQAFSLSAETSQMLDAAFGPDGAKDLTRGATLPASGLIRRPAEFPIAYTVGRDSSLKRAPLADVLGMDLPTTDADVRGGIEVFKKATLPKDPASQRSTLLRVQRALNDGNPVLVYWLVDYAGIDTQGRIQKPSAPGKQEFHLSVLTDYEITSVPGFGTLPVGVKETRAQALQASLDPAAKITLFRLKNSWGDRTGLVQEQYRGFFDVAAGYFQGPISDCRAGTCTDAPGFASFILPPGY
jgi:hypothetical protein